MKLRIPFCVILITAMFTSCAPSNSGQTSNNISSEDDIIQTSEIEWADVFKQEEDHYIVFFYSETCEHCHQIMGDVTAFAREDIVKTYFLNIKKGDAQIPINSDVEYTIGATKIEDLSIRGTPTIVEITDFTVTANVAGKEKCLTLLYDLKSSANK